MRKLFALLAVCALVPFAIAACGGDDEEEPAAEDTGGGGGGATVSVAADPGGELAYVQKSLSASAGENTFEFDNPSSTEHDFCVEDGGETAASGEPILVYHTSNASCTDVITGETTTTPPPRTWTPASTPSTAASPATATRGWKGRSPSTSCRSSLELPALCKRTGPEGTDSSRTQRDAGEPGTRRLAADSGRGDTGRHGGARR